MTSMRIAAGLGLVGVLALAGPALAAEDPLSGEVDEGSDVLAPDGHAAQAVAERRCTARSRCSTTVRTHASVRVRTTSRSPVVRPAPPPPPPRVVRQAPPRPVVVPVAPRRTVVVRRPAPPPRVVMAPPHVRSTTVIVRPWHGVFVYGPRPVYHREYVPAAPSVVQDDHLPNRRVDREGSFALGLRSGSYISGYENGGSYGDFGLGVVGRYRPEEALGLELLVQHHNETFDLTTTERAQTLGQGSVMLFANPWGRVQPYVLGGLSTNARSLNDAVASDLTVQTNDLLWGPHAGAGVELAFGRRAALDLEARYVGWMNDREASMPGALQTSANFMLHF